MTFEVSPNPSQSVILFAISSKLNSSSLFSVLDREDGSAESLCIKVRGQTNMDDIALGVCCRPRDQDKKVDGAFFGHLKENLHHRPCSSWKT